MEPRMKNPAMIIPDARQAIQALAGAVQKGGFRRRGNRVDLRVSQINGECLR